MHGLHGHVSQETLTWLMEILFPCHAQRRRTCQAGDPPTRSDSPTPSPRATPRSPRTTGVLIHRFRGDNLRSTNPTVKTSCAFSCFLSCCSRALLVDIPSKPAQPSKPQAQP